MEGIDGRERPGRILVLNCGSATIKYRYFEAGVGEARVQLAGMVEGVPQRGPRRADNAGEARAQLAGVVEVSGDYGAALREIIDSLPSLPEAVGHRVVHGGERYRGPVFLTSEVIEELGELSLLAPLHNPPAMEGIRAVGALGIVQVAVFDTSFHATIPAYASTYALPCEVGQDSHLRRYGFHGLSHQYVMERFAQLTGKRRPTIITLHLGNGASIAAIAEGRCVDTSMGFTPLEGLVMGTRCGDLDPAIPLRLLREGRSLDEVEHLLWHRSGLLGLAGERDMRLLLQRDDKEAQLAIDIFCYRARKYIGAYYAALGRLEGIVFTGGIGENAPEVRWRILDGLEALGIRADKERNHSNAQRISEEASPLPVMVIPTNEERLIARELLRLFERQEESPHLRMKKNRVV